MILGIGILYHFPTKPSTPSFRLRSFTDARRPSQSRESSAKPRVLGAHDPKKNTMGFDGQFIATKTAEVIPKGSLVRETKMALIKAKA